MDARPAHMAVRGNDRDIRAGKVVSGFGDIDAMSVAIDTIGRDIVAMSAAIDVIGGVWT